MVSAINKEFLAICSVKHIKGSSLTPRHQPICERGHQITMINHLILMNAVCQAYPQEWAALVDALEYLYETMPQSPHGLSAHDMSVGYAICTTTDRRLAPFRVPKGLPESDVCVRLFENWRELYALFSRATMEKSLRDQVRINKTRHLWVGSWRDCVPPFACKGERPEAPLQSYQLRPV